MPKTNNIANDNNSIVIAKYNSANIYNILQLQLGHLTLIGWRRYDVFTISPRVLK